MKSVAMYSAIANVVNRRVLAEQHIDEILENESLWLSDPGPMSVLNCWRKSRMKGLIAVWVGHA